MGRNINEGLLSSGDKGKKKCMNYLIDKVNAAHNGIKLHESKEIDRW